ncbi:phosphoribosylglycinamide synthetase [Sphingomonas sp. AP4-R1]|uniref:D-alanine--D-alanine ligase family protein n=1 Tax=Sphingomonas sp. AP4-R1 TaxID=2735134 RepID=UPI00149332AE|nr:phosphoribosylglycinamide synthetase [Sphingomonas sp. AP4-R1]QJU59493.1 phosphoribosylglycinamide synthetase [Sphingomonas sp. AP4-R1]
MYIRPKHLSDATRSALRIMLIAKHAAWEQGAHPEDGTHAVYHQEMRATLERLGLHLTIADRYEALFERPDVDFVFPLLNRGGFLNSEMLVPLLCERHGLPYLGASPILRGLSDDKHLTKMAAVARGLRTAPWAIYRRGAPIDLDRRPAASHWVVKPNASSASWGVSAVRSRGELREAIQKLHAEGHDAIVEPFIVGHDVEVSVITVDGKPVMLPTQIVEQCDPATLRTYNEKRNLTADQAYEIRPLQDVEILAEVEAATAKLAPEYLPFDYGRFEYRIDVTTGDVMFLEVNLNCNLWSRKTISMAARQIGWSHDQLIETILAEAIERHGLAMAEVDLAA